MLADRRRGLQGFARQRIGVRRGSRDAEGLCHQLLRPRTGNVADQHHAHIVRHIPLPIKGPHIIDG